MSGLPPRRLRSARRAVRALGPLLAWFVAVAPSPAATSPAAAAGTVGPAVHAPAPPKAALPAAPDAAARMSAGSAPEWVLPRAFDDTPSTAERVQGHPTEYLLLDYQARGFGKPEYYTHVVARVLTADGVDEFGEITLNFDPGYQTLTWHSLRVIREGRAIDQLDLAKVRLLQRETEMEAKLFDGSVSAVAVLDDLRAGDVVEYAFTVSGENPIFGGRLSLSYTPASDRPLRQYAVRVLDAADRPLVTKANAAKIAPLLPGARRDPAAELRVTETPAGREYSWEGRDLEPLEGEDGAPEWFDPWPRIELGEYADWGAVVRWALDLYAVPEELPADLEERLAGWKRQFPQPELRAEAAVRFVQDEIRYLGIEAGENSHRPHPPAEVFARRFGDCKDKTTLAVTLLRRLGVKAWPALISSGGGPEIPAFVPSPYVFDHVIVAYELGGVLRFADPTIQRQGGRLPDSVVPPYDWSLLVRAGEEKLTPVVRAKHDEPLRQVRERFVFAAGSDEARLEVETVYLGPEADDQRQMLARTPRQRLAMHYLNFYARDFPGVELAGEPSWNDDRARNRVVVRESYVVHDAWTIDDEAKQKRIEFSAREIAELVEKPPTLRRRTPLGLAWPVHIRQTIEIVLPGGWSVKPERYQKDSPLLSFRARSSAKGDTLTLDYVFRLKADLVAPEAMRTYVKSLDEVSEHLSYPVEVEAETLQRKPLR